MEKAVKGAAEWNKQMNAERKEKRQAYFDMQTFVVQRPMNGHGKMRVIKPPKVGSYPVALIPGQFVDHYKRFNPEQLAHLPLNTALKEPPQPGVKLADLGSEGGKDGRAGDDDSSSSSSDDSSSEDSSSDSSDSEDEEDAPLAAADDMVKMTPAAKADEELKRAVGKMSFPLDKQEAVLQYLRNNQSTKAKNKRRSKYKL